ncbi:hypothetical protein B0H16DRAFT_1479809 [Mycena metata]|uniref:Uncharacterized protein n=1 Tax=Mycena metata TaxID=1033252 RepID=A0AAD7H4A0_9AGAR|nr:hypothetical protein B0H16DRAFT_1479809 [Mycena metata]
MGTSVHVVVEILDVETDDNVDKADSKYVELEGLPVVASAWAKRVSDPPDTSAHVPIVPNTDFTAVCDEIQGITPTFPLARCIVYFGKTPEPGVMVGVLRVWNPRRRGRHWSSARVDCDESTYLSTHPIFELWARAVPPGLPEPRIINGGQYAGVEFHEYASPYIDLGAAPTIPLTEWWREERRIKEKFKSVYPDSHPDRLNSSPAFLCASRYLIARLACAHGVFALRSALHLAAEKVTRELEKAAAAAAAVEASLQTAMAPLLETEYLSAWLDVPGYKIYRLGTSEWSAEYIGEERIAEGWGQWGDAGSFTGWDNTSGWGTGTGWPNTSGGGADTTAWGWGPDNTWVGPGSKRTWDVPFTRRVVVPIVA